jgi:hypothetical protein
MAPEQQARQSIDTLLQQAGWHVATWLTPTFTHRAAGHDASGERGFMRPALPEAHERMPQSFGD